MRIKNFPSNKLDVIQLGLVQETPLQFKSQSTKQSFFKLIRLFLIFGGHKSFLWGKWYSCFGLQVMSPLGFKARVGSLICIWERCTVLVTHSLRFTSGATPADLLATSMADRPFSSTCLWAGIGGDQNWDLLCLCCLTVWDQADTLLTELCRLGFN